MAMPSDLDPALASVLQDIADRGLVPPDPATNPLPLARRINEAYFGYIAEPRPEVGLVESFRVNSVPVKIVWPQGRVTSGAVLIYCHGGGFTFASMHTHERLMRVLALAAGMPVIGIDYRRTPEHPFPAARDDALAVWHFVTGGGLGFNPPKIGVVGDSAGGTLAMALTASLRDAGSRLPDALGLIYPMMDTRTDSASHRRFGDGRYGLSSARTTWFWNAYLRPGDRADPMAVPALIDVTGFPPAAIFLAGCDCLVSDGDELKDRFDAAGVRASLRRWPGVTHGFVQLGAVYPPADAALGDVGREMVALLR
jgi:acetyl esterase